MYDLERMNKMIDDIRRFFLDLEFIKIDEKNIQDPNKLHSASMLIFGIINRSIDLADEMLVKNDLPMPSHYHECFPILAKAGLIDKNLAIQLENLTRERGLFAHHYYDINHKKVLKLAKDAYIVKQFTEKVKKIVEKEKKNEK